MKQYLTKFSTRAEYTAALENLDFPNVTYLSEDDELVFAQNAPEPPVHDYSLDYFTIEITDGTDVLHVGDGHDTESLQHSVDGGNTWESHVEPDGMEVKAGDKIMFKCTDHLTPYDSIIAFDGDATYNVYGNIMSLVYGDDFVGKTSLWKDSDFTFTTMFSNTSVVDASNLVLPATTLPMDCYGAMFNGCMSLTKAPKVLPATTLSESCYSSMFAGCQSLTAAPELPATELADSCYEDMFNGCTSLTTAPELPATTLTNNCYTSMFSGCTALTTAPELPATELADSCYSGMFANTNLLPDVSSIDFTDANTVQSGYLRGLFQGTKITDADLARILPKNAQDKPCLPVTTLASNCYENMFAGCTSLTTAPELPATTLAQSCYWAMFAGCTSLTSAPELPATTLAQNCYGIMFTGCTSLTTTPELPATTLAQSCYSQMFDGCTSLTTAPELPATTLAQSCYSQMFFGCTSLNYIKMLATDVSATNCLNNWVNRVSSTGTFVKHPNANLPSGTNGIPAGWTVETATA